MKSVIQNSLNECSEVLTRFLNNPESVSIIEKAATLIAEALARGNKVISCGNGGSLCDATHFAEELTGRYRHNRLPFPAISINDPAYITCVANDFGFEYIFSRYVESVGKEGDVLLAITRKRDVGHLSDRKDGSTSLRFIGCLCLCTRRQILRPGTRNTYQSDSHPD